MYLKLINNLTKVSNSIEVSDDSSKNSYWKFKIVLPKDMVDGEYSYELVEDGKIKGTGLVQIGDYVPIKQEYNEKEEYITYNGD